MFNIQPGQGLGQTASREIALGLGNGPGPNAVVIQPKKGSGSSYDDTVRRQYEYDRRIREDDEEIIEIVKILLKHGIL